MAITLTKNLKLKVDSTFDDLSKYNLAKIDTLASLFQINTNELAIVRSKTDIVLEPESADVGGSGVGGSVSIGSADHVLDSVSIFATTVNFGGGTLTLADTATGGTTSLLLSYKSDLNGLVDTTNRNLKLDLDGADRNLILGGNLSLVGSDLAINISNLTNGQILAYNSSTQTFVNQDPTTPTSSEIVVTWATADGVTKLITHGFNSRDVDVQLFDENFQTVEVDSVTRTTVNTVTLLASSAPTGNWTVLLKKIG